MSAIEDTAQRLARTTVFAYDNLHQAGLLLAKHGLGEEQAARQVEELARGAALCRSTPLRMAAGLVHVMGWDGEAEGSR